MQWININDRLPDDAERVLLYTPYPFLGDDYACVGNRACIMSCTARVDRRKVPVFTHWMPLPPGPEQQTRGQVTEECVLPLPACSTSAATMG